MPRPNTPTFSLTAGKGKITAKWNNIKGADGYSIYRASSKNGEYKKVEDKNVYSKASEAADKKVK